MWFFKYLLVLALTISGLCETEETFAVELTTDSFATAIKDNNHFVMFFAPWCGHCKRLHPLWEQLAEMMNIKDPRVIIAKVDCTVYQELCAKNEVTGYPTLKFFKVGSSESVKFKGTRDLPTITDFIQEQLGDKESLGDGYLDSTKSANKLTELTDETFPSYVASGKHFVKFYAPWCSHCQRLAPTWEELANSLETDTNVKISKIDCTQYRPICQNFEVKGYPTLLWIEDGKKIEKYSGARSREDLTSYISKMLGTPKEEKQPEEEKTEEEDGSLIKQISASDFEETIAKGTTFVKFYVPWCGHCQKLSPIWEQLATKLHKKPDIVIAKVDCTLPDNKKLCVEQQVEGYPSLYIYRNGERLAEYVGSRQLDDLYSFATRYWEHDEL